MDREDHFKVVGLKKSGQYKETFRSVFRHFILHLRAILFCHLNKYNMNVHMCYTIQYSQYVKQTFLRLLLFEVTCSAEASLAILIAGNKILCS